MSNTRIYTLAIETSSRVGSVTLGCDDSILQTVKLPSQRRCAVELIPTIDTLCKRHGAKPTDLNEVYVSVGPGSFTGLRISIATAKMIGRHAGAKLVAVPTLDVVVQNAPPPPNGPDCVAVMLNAKRGQCYTGLYDWLGDRWSMTIDASLLTPDELINMQQEKPFAVIGDHLPEYDWPNTVQLLDKALAVPHSEVVWQLGRQLAEQGRFVDPVELLPLYVRLPEAEENWRAEQQA